MTPYFLLGAGWRTCHQHHQSRLDRSLDGDNLGGLILELLDLRVETPPGLVNSLLATDNLARHRDLLGNLLGLGLVVKVDPDAERLAQAVDGLSSLTDQMRHVFLVDGKLDGVAIDDVIVLGILDNLLDLLGDALDLARWTADGDDVLVLAVLCLAVGGGLAPNLDRNELVLANESVEDGTALTDDITVPLLVHVERLGLDVRGILGEIGESGRGCREDLLELGVASLLVGWETVGRPGVNEKNLRALLPGAGRR